MPKQNSFTPVKLVEKRNHLAVHGLFDSMASATRHLAETIPVYVARGYFMDKSLKPDDFEIIGDTQNADSTCLGVIPPSMKIQ